LGLGRVLGAALAVSVTLVVVAAALWAGLPPCGVAAAAYLAGFLLLGGLGLVLVVLPRLCRPGLRVEDGRLVVELGACGRLVAPLAAVREVRVVERVGLLARLAGTAVPGLYYSGLYMLRGGGRARVFAERLHGLVEVVLDGGERLLVGGDALRALGELRERLRGREGGGSVAGGLRREGPGVVLGLAAVVVAASTVASLVLLLAVPQRVPLHYGKGWVPDRWGTRAELAAVVAVVLGLSWLFVVLAWRILDPVSSLLLAVAASGLSLLALSTVLLSVPSICPAAWSPAGG